MKTGFIFGLAGMLTGAVLWFKVLDNPCSTAHARTSESGSIASSTPWNDARGQGMLRDQARVVIPVEGMTCGGCASAITLTLKRLDGVLFTKADPEKGTATVMYEKDKLSVEQIVEAINKTGYKALPPGEQGDR